MAWCPAGTALLFTGRIFRVDKLSGLTSAVVFAGAKTPAQQNAPPILQPCWCSGCCDPNVIFTDSTMGAGSGYGIPGFL